MWIGQCGVHFYHIHKRDDERWDTFAGGDPIARGDDPGRLYILFTTAQVDWVNLTLRSALEYFPRARRFGANCEVTTAPGATEFLAQMDDATKAEAEKIRTLPEEKQFDVPFAVGFEQRFLAKIALGLGYKLFGTAFLATENAKRLRGVLWEKDPTKHSEFELRGAGYLDAKDDQTSEFMGWKGAYTIRLQAVGQYLCLSLHLPSNRVMHVLISDAPSLWHGADFESLRSGLVYLVFPTLQRFVDAIPLPQYISHRLGNNRIPELEEIEAQKVDIASLPPCR